MRVILTIQDPQAPFLLELLRSLEYVNIEEQVGDNFILSDVQLTQLEKGSEIPINFCISRDDLEKRIRKKYDF